MKKPKVEKVNLPYASTVASFYGDQSSAQGNSFLGKMFGNGARTIVENKFAAPVVKAPLPVKMGNK